MFGQERNAVHGWLQPASCDHIWSEFWPPEHLWHFCFAGISPAVAAVTSDRVPEVSKQEEPHCMAHPWVRPPGRVPYLAANIERMAYAVLACLRVITVQATAHMLHLTDACGMQGDQHACGS